MGVISQRFTGIDTLHRCVDDGYRMLPGEPDRAAVTALQRALLDLGYAVRGGDDGAFGGGTADAVVAFKRDEGLAPTDGVASRGTIGRLDDYFAHEPVDPDVPDATTAGLAAILERAMVTAVEWTRAAVAALTAFPAGLADSEDPAWLDREERLQRDFHLAQLRMSRETAIEQVVLPVYREIDRALSPPSLFLIEPETRAAWEAGFPGQPYLDLAEHVGARLSVMPPFRNVLDDVERVCAVLRAGAGLDGRVSAFAVPGTPRFANLGADGLLNKNAYAAFAFESVHPGQVRLRPRYRWQA